MKIQLLEDRLIVKPDETPDKTAGGIFIPQSRGGADLEPRTGVVTHRGDGRYSEKHANWARDSNLDWEYLPVKMPLRVEVGDRVVYNAYAVTKWEQAGTTYCIITERDVIGVINEDHAVPTGVAGA